MKRTRLARSLVLITAVGTLTAAAPPGAGGRQATSNLTIRGQTITLRTFGQRGQPAVIVASGDGGWMHLGPHVASVLAARGFFVVGVDAKEYLTRFTANDSTLTEADVPRDYKAIVEYAASGSTQAPILAGVSEGAALSLLAATTDDVKKAVGGVIAIGMPDKAELGWRWRDALIYVTHGVPNEPTFSTAAVIERVSPIPVAAIHSTHDEFVPLDTINAVMARAKEPKRLWTIDAADHRFSDKTAEFDARLIEAVAWITARGK